MTSINALPICPHDELCGGCVYQKMPYQDQVIHKGKEIISCMNDFGIDLSSLDEPFDAKNIVSAPQIYHYRNKMEYSFGNLTRDGELTLGMHQKKRFMSVLTVDQCQLVPNDFNKIVTTTLNFAKVRNYNFCHRRTHVGLLRNLVVRQSIAKKEILVCIVTTSQINFASDEYVNELLALNATLDGCIVGILHVIHNGKEDAVCCDELRVLYGRDYYIEEICGLEFRVSIFSFFQTNVLAVSRLYQSALSLIPQSNLNLVYDLFCGTGTITQLLAQKAKRVVGVELVDDAVKSAMQNAKRNHLANCTFYAGDVFNILDNLKDEPDLIVVDPPRMGISDKALHKIAGYRAPYILYISCNPRTLAQNASYLAGTNYKLTRLLGFDNFPMTKHIECVALFKRTN